MNIIEIWMHLNKVAPVEKCSRFFHSQRRHIADNRFPNWDVSTTLKETIKLLSAQKETSRDDCFLFYYGMLKKHINAGVVMDKISNSKPFENSYIIHEPDLFSNQHYNWINIPKRIPYWVYLSLSFFVDYLKYRKNLPINIKQLIHYLTYQSALIVYLMNELKNQKVISYITYNDFFGLTADISFACNLASINVYNIQHGVLSEISYPGLANIHILWGEESKRKCLNLGYKESELVVLGAACFNAIPSNLPNNKCFTFFSQTISELNFDKRYAIEMKNWIKECAKIHTNWSFIIRLHPHEHSGKFYSDLSNLPNVTIEHNNERSIVDLLKITQVAGTFFSGAGIDTMLMQRILLVFNPLDSIPKTNWIKNGCTSISNKNEFVNLLSTLNEQEAQKIIAKQNLALREEITKIQAEEEIAFYIWNREIIKKSKT